MVIKTPLNATQRLLVWRPILWFVLLGALLVFIWWAFWHPRIVITTQAFERADMELGVSAVGKLKPLQLVDVGAQVSGRILRILVKAGDQVKKGDLLLEIDPEIQEAEVRSDRAQLKNLQALLQEQQANEAFLRHKQDRYAQLLGVNAISQQEHQETQKELAAVRARMDSLRAQIEGAESKLKGNLTLLGYTRIYASIDGTVITLDALEGQTINATYQIPRLLQLANLQKMTVWAEVSEADVGRIQADMPVYFTTLGLRDEHQQLRRWHGHLRQLLPAPPLPAQEAGGEAEQSVNRIVTYTALFDVDNADAQLLPQMTARVFFIEDRAKDALLVPLKYLEFNAERKAYQVRVMPQGGREESDLQLRVLKLGLQDQLNAQVLEGLQPGDRLVTQLSKQRGLGHIRW